MKHAATIGGALVLGFGNELRRDDGLGPVVARTVEARGVPGVCARGVHQLTPELAEELSRAALAIFVDARVEPKTPAVEARRLEAGRTSASSTHLCDPRDLLSLAIALYGRAPEAWLVSIAGHEFGPGEGLSERSRSQIDEAVRVIGELLRARTGIAGFAESR